MDAKSKTPNVLSLIQRLFDEGAFLVSRHAQLRQGQRQLSLGDIKATIRSGFHEKRKDEFREEFGDWTYAIRGRTLDNEQARVCVAIDEGPLAVVVTVIRLER